jgi:DNA-binding winged helix-turn-helix (wHTH) protein
VTRHAYHTRSSSSRLQSAQKAFKASLKQAHDVLQGDAVTPHAFIPHGPEILSAVLHTKAATVPVVRALECFILNGSEIQIQICASGYSKARLRGSTVPRKQAELLQERPFQILAALLERPGEVVTRKEIRQKLRPTNTFVDLEHSINRAVNKLRGALGDDVENPRFVETLPRFGYRLIAPVEILETNGVRPALEMSPDAPGAR